MRTTYERLCWVSLWVLTTVACAPLSVQPKPEQGERDAEATPISGQLPAELKALQTQGLELRGDRVVFEGVLNFPPKLKGVPTTSSVKLDVTPGPRPSVREARQPMRAAAVADPRVKDAIGDRYSLLVSGWLDAPKGTDTSPAEDRYRMIFYNYAKNAVVTVIASRQGQELEISSEPVRVQPAESREEVDAAIEIVRSDPRYGQLIETQTGRGIQTEGRENNRYLYLLFYREPRTPATFEATVDMSAGRVVEARPLR